MSYLGGDCGGGSGRGGIQKVLLLGQNGRQCDHFTVAVHYHVKCVMLLSCYPPDHCLYRLGPAPRCHQCHISHTDAFVISLALYSDQSTFHPRRRNFWNNCWHMCWNCWLIWKGTIFLSFPHANTEFGLTVGLYNFRTRWPLNDDMERWGVFRVGQSLLYIPQAPTTQSHPEPPLHLTLILGRGNRNEAKSITAVRSRPYYFFAKKQGASNPAWYATRFQKCKQIERFQGIWKWNDYGNFFLSNMNINQKCDTA